MDNRDSLSKINQRAGIFNCPAFFRKHRNRCRQRLFKICCQVYERGRDEPGDRAKKKIERLENSEPEHRETEQELKDDKRAK